VEALVPVPDISALPPDAFLTIKQVAGLTGFAPYTVKCWRKYGRGPKVTTINGRPRFRVADLREWLGLAAREAA